MGARNEKFYVIPWRREEDKPFGGASKRLTWKVSALPKLASGVGQMSRRHSFRLNGNGKAPGYPWIEILRRVTFISTSSSRRFMHLAKNSYLPLHANERLHRVVDVLAFRFFALYLTPSDNQLINSQFSYSNSFQKRQLVKLQVTKRSRKNRSWFTHRRRMISLVELSLSLIATINRLSRSTNPFQSEAFRKHSSAFLSKEQAHRWNVRSSIDYLQRLRVVTLCGVEKRKDWIVNEENILYSDPLSPC